MVNQVIIVGEVCEIQKKDGAHLLRLKVRRNFKDNDGFFRFDYISCKLWKGIVDSIQEYYHPGQILSVCGRLQSEDEMDGTIVIAEKIDFMSRVDHQREMEGSA